MHMPEHPTFGSRIPADAYSSSMWLRGTDVRRSSNSISARSFPASFDKSAGICFPSIYTGEMLKVRTHDQNVKIVLATPLPCSACFSLSLRSNCSFSFPSRDFLKMYSRLSLALRRNAIRNRDRSKTSWVSPTGQTNKCDTEQTVATVRGRCI